MVIDSVVEQLGRLRPPSSDTAVPRANTRSEECVSLARVIELYHHFRITNLHLGHLLVEERKRPEIRFGELLECSSRTRHSPLNRTRVEMLSRG
jgi:hypothetical protein